MEILISPHLAPKVMEEGKKVGINFKIDVDDVQRYIIITFI